jgi:hypothetical protein
MICLYYLLRYPRITIYADRVVVVRQTYRPGDIKALDLSVEEDYMHGRYWTPMMYVLAFTIDDGTGERTFRLNVCDLGFNPRSVVAELRRHLPHLKVRGMRWPLGYVLGTFCMSWNASYLRLRRSNTSLLYL